MLQRVNGIANVPRRVSPPSAGVVGCVRRPHAPQLPPQPEPISQERQVVQVQPMEMDPLPSALEPFPPPSNPMVQDDVAALLEYRPPAVQHPQAGIAKQNNKKNHNIREK